jgi:D-galactarolactone isomerase
VGALAHRLIAHAPERMLWATNWPHPGQADPLTTDDLAALRDQWLPTEALRHQVLVDNAAEVYGFEPIPHTITNRQET